MSASIRPTRWPARASATARLAETVDLPTPPFPDDTASALPRCGMATGVGGGGTEGPGPPGAAAPCAGARATALGSVTLTRTPLTPATACTVRRGSPVQAGGAGVGEGDEVIDG